MIKDSRSLAFRNASAHATMRIVLATKLSNLNSAFVDAPSLLASRLNLLLAALRLAQDEVQWWVLHTDVVLEQLPRKERDAERDPRAFHPASVQALLSLSSQLCKVVVENRAKLVEAAIEQMGLYKSSISEHAVAIGSSGMLTGEASALLSELPSHVGLASEVGADLFGLRLNILRLVCELSKPPLFTHVASSASIKALLRDVHATATLSLAIDNTEPFVTSASEPTALLADANSNACLLALLRASQRTA